MAGTSTGRVMNRRTENFLVGANLSVSWTLRAISQDSEKTDFHPEVFYLAIPWDGMTPNTEPILEAHHDFIPENYPADLILRKLREFGHSSLIPTGFEVECN